MTKHDPTHGHHEPDFTNRPRKSKWFSRFTVIDAHLERLAIKERHPEHPTLTAYALHILEQAERSNKNKARK